MSVDRIIALIVGVWIIGVAITVAVRTFMMPGAQPGLVTKGIFRSTQVIIQAAARRMRSPRRRQELLGIFAPVALLIVLFYAVGMVGVGYAFIFHAAGGGGFYQSVYYSASSISTLGFAEPPLKSVTLTMLTVFETMSSAAIISLLIGYLPNIYSDYTTREQTVVKLMGDVDDSTSGIAIVEAFSKSPGLERMDEAWKDWSTWFSHLATSHASITGALFMRSPVANVSWVAVAGAVLDACALILSSVDTTDDVKARAERCLSAGTKAVNRVAAALGAHLDPKPGWPGTPITVEQEEFNAGLDRLTASGVKLVADREAAWTGFAQHRVLYDQAIIALCRSKMVTEGQWSGDREASRQSLPIPLRGVRDTKL